MALDGAGRTRMLDSVTGRGTAIASNTGPSSWRARRPTGGYLRAGSFRETGLTIQAINRLEFDGVAHPPGTGELLELFPNGNEAWPSACDAFRSALNWLQTARLSRTAPAISRRLGKVATLSMGSRS